MLEKLMQQFSQDLELDQPMHTEMHGVYTVALEEDLVVNISEMGQGIHFTCTLGPTPKGNEEAFFTQTLLANLFGQGTKGAVLALNDEGSELKLTRDIDYRLEYREFRDMLEDFINAVDFWREEMLNYK